ncbi:MAG: hypothetical protein JOZ62_07235 [Acidobacteriaceae bacterium]|nr:hypothetical protein [Acidobacteriaceae bacterium]
MTVRFAPATALGFLLLSSCGYHVGGRADLMPKSIQTIAIPAFNSSSTRYRLADTLPNDIAREFRERTRFHILQDPSEADAVLNGSIISVQIYPGLFDPSSGKVTSVQINVTLTLNLLEHSTGRVLYSRANFSARQNYEVATDPHQFFDESGPAFTRLNRDVAHDVVSAIVENF